MLKKNGRMVKVGSHDKNKRINMNEKVIHCCITDDLVFEMAESARMSTALSIISIAPTIHPSTKKNNSIVESVL